MDVEITLNGKVETLRPTLAAAKRVNAQGGFAHVVGRIQAADLEAYILVVAAGLNKKTSDKIGDVSLEEAVYKTGLPALGAEVVKFVNLLANGGKPMESEGGEGGSGEA